MSPRNASEVGQRRIYTFGGEKYPSVTTLLKGWPQEWAIGYGAKHVAERAMTDEHLTRLHRIEYGEPEYDETLKWLKRAPYERRDAAAEAGTDLHAYLECILTGGKKGFCDGELTDGQKAIEGFVMTYRPTPLHVECQVFNPAEGYAGSADAFLEIYGKRYVFDLKTGIVDHKTRLQLAAYRYADFIGEDDERIADVPMTDGALVLSVPRDNPASWQLLEVDAGVAEFEMFLDYKRAWQFYDRNKDRPVGELLLPQADGGS